MLLVALEAVCPADSFRFFSLLAAVPDTHRAEEGSDCADRRLLKSSLVIYICACISVCKCVCGWVGGTYTVCAHTQSLSLSLSLSHTHTHTHRYRCRAPTWATLSAYSSLLVALWSVRAREGEGGGAPLPARFCCQLTSGMPVLSRSLSLSLVGLFGIYIRSLLTLAVPKNLLVPDAHRAEGSDWPDLRLYNSSMVTYTPHVCVCVCV